MKRICLLCLSAILLVVSGCGARVPVSTLETPFQPNHWQIERLSLRRQWCLGLCPDYEALP